MRSLPLVLLFNLTLAATTLASSTRPYSLQCDSFGAGGQIGVEGQFDMKNHANKTTKTKYGQGHLVVHVPNLGDFPGTGEMGWDQKPDQLTFFADKEKTYQSKAFVKAFSVKFGGSEVQLKWSDSGLERQYPVPLICTFKEI